MKQLYVLTAVLMFLSELASLPAYGASLQLSQAELAWLENNKTIRISGPQAFPPFQYVDPNDGVFKGMASDYIYCIAEMVGLNIEVVKDLPWSVLLEKIEKKEIDVLTIAANTEARAHYLLYTKPHISFPLVIISRKDAPFIGGLDSLHDKTIAVTRKVSTIEWLQRDKINAVPSYVNTPLEALKRVSLGRADVAIENLAAATYLIEKNGLTNLKIAAPTSYGNYTLSIAVRRDWPELAGILDKGLAAISPEQHNEIRQKWIAVRYEYGIGVRDIITWILIVVCIAVVFLSGFYLWNRKLAHEIRERKKTESEKEKIITELRGALKEIKTLRGILPICSHCKKIRDDKGAWNQLEHYIHEHSEAEFSHGICLECAKKYYPEFDIYDEESTGSK
jgi:two-component system sensor histidine kinase EvgS